MACLSQMVFAVLLLATITSAAPRANVSGLYGLVMASQQGSVHFNLMLINGNTTDLLPVEGSAKCPAYCIPSDLTSQADVAVIPQGPAVEARLATFFRCICQDKTPSGSNRVTPPIVVTIGLDSLQLKTVAKLTTDEYNGNEINGFKLGHNDAGPPMVVMSGFHHDNSSTAFGRTVRRFVSIDLATGASHVLFDKFQQCPQGGCGPQDIPYAGFGFSLQLHADGDWPSMWVDGYDHYFGNGTEAQGMQFAGIGLQDGKSVFNRTVGVGMWSLVQNLYTTPYTPQGTAPSPYHADLFSLGLCCNPADGVPNCPKECSGTGPDNRKVVLVNFPDAVGHPSNFSVKWVGSMEDLGILTSSSTGAAFDPITKTYYHMVQMKVGGFGVLRFQDGPSKATQLPTWLLPGEQPLSIRFRNVPKTSASLVV